MCKLFKDQNQELGGQRAGMSPTSAGQNIPLSRRASPCNFIHPLSRIILFFLLVFFAAKSAQKQPELFGSRHSRVSSRVHDLVHNVKTTTIVRLSTKRQKGHLTTFKVV